ncbi:MAG: beta-ketoacyl synthase N-terminal-like domain-containing protein, partial [Bacillota bacterium]|nr:beta-ketoacyl synthase N-terminal-like domain-containing protein [Bacillota bacterium]
MNTYFYPEERIAIVAMSGLFPDANNVNDLWNNILNKKISIRELPDYIFDKEVLFRPETFKKSNKGDKTYTKIAAIPDISDYSVLSKKYKIPPFVAEYMDPNQHSTIYCVEQALDQLKNKLPREKTAVILNSGSPGRNFENVVRRIFFARVENELLRNAESKSSPIYNDIENIVKRASEKLLKETRQLTEDSSTGYLQNLTVGRITNIFDFWGPSYTVDSACSSAMTAVSLSVAGLLNYEFDAAITGGVEVTLTEVGLTAFSAINALSPDGSYPFDSRANGFVMGLGGGILVLKRLSDALRDGDHIYSIISGYGQGSDGKGKYIAAPSVEGQVRVIKNAINMADYSVETVEMVEAHGTGTIVGDITEISALKEAFSSLGANKKNYCGVGSIKSNIGHLRNAAGVAGIIKASLALDNKFLPPTANVKEINPKLQIEESPFYILTEGMKWKETPAHPRRANISSYGFGGADNHICLEEFRPEFLKKTYSIKSNAGSKSSLSSKQNSRTGEEVILFSGDNFEELKYSFEEFVKDQNDHTDFEKSVFNNNLRAFVDKEWRIAVCARSLDELKEKWDFAKKSISEDRLNEEHILKLKGIFVGRGSSITS